MFVWLPSHVGIQGNTDADVAAKTALNTAPDNIPVPHTDFWQQVDDYYKSKWQTLWDSQTNNKLYSIKPKIGITHFGNQLGRREEQILHRLRIGHTHLTHAFILQREEKPICSTCNCPLTVEHILLTCNLYGTQRNQYFKVSCLNELF